MASLTERMRSSKAGLTGRVFHPVKAVIERSFSTHQRRLRWAARPASPTCDLDMRPFGLVLRPLCNLMITHSCRGPSSGPWFRVVSHRHSPLPAPTPDRALPPQHSLTLLSRFCLKRAGEEVGCSRRWSLQFFGSPLCAPLGIALLTCGGASGSSGGPRHLDPPSLQMPAPTLHPAGCPRFAVASPHRGTRSQFPHPMGELKQTWVGEVPNLDLGGAVSNHLAHLARRGVNSPRRPDPGSASPRTPENPGTAA
jgi:hypothetical protein